MLIFFVKILTSFQVLKKQMSPTEMNCLCLYVICDNNVICDEKAWTIHFSWRHLLFFNLEIGKDLDKKKSAKFLYFSDSANLTQFHFVPLTKSSLQNLQEKISTLMKKEILLNLQHIIKLQKLCNFFCQNLHQYPSPKKAYVVNSNELSMPSCPIYALFIMLILCQIY